MKRVFDLGVASLALITTMPLLTVVAVAVWLDLGRPILYRQERPGLNGKPFQIVKFRTMRNIAAADTTELADAARLSRLGRWLRASSLDELPELWNVLRGEMSLVGPRPLLTEYLPLYSPEQRRRHDVRPGITGWAQIHGRNALPWEERFELDVWYVDHQSLWLDLEILCRTVGKVLSRTGITEDGQATMSKFTGTPS